MLPIRSFDGTSAHLMISCKNSHVSMPSFGLCSWASSMARTVVFLRKTGGTELNVLHPPLYHTSLEMKYLNLRILRMITNPSSACSFRLGQARLASHREPERAVCLHLRGVWHSHATIYVVAIAFEGTLVVEWCNRRER